MNTAIRAGRTGRGEDKTMGEIRFLLNGEEHRVTDPSPTLTLLDWLRLDARRTGSKEGCAEGDCGACTVALGGLDADDGLHWKAVNSCIALLGQVDGKAVLTVEGLSQDVEAQHPVQDALVRHHASQCGFCTPGFAMSLFAFQESGPVSDGDEAIHDALAGNLCRCTGYRPIVDAAREIATAPLVDAGLSQSEYIQALKALRRDDTVSLHRDGRSFHAPRSAAELAELLARHPRARLLAGGTDLGLEVTKLNRKLDCVIWLGACDDLKGIAVTPQHIEIGAAVTYEEALPVLAADFPSFATLIRRIGSRQIRNHGTLCGNIANASPIGDTPPALIALGAVVILRRGEALRSLPLEEFFLDYRKTALAEGEFIAAIRIPRADPAELFRTYKISKRYDQDISAVCAAFRLTLEGGQVRQARIAYGGMAATPVRARALEEALIGKAWTLTTARSLGEAAEKAFRPLSDFRASAAYRAKVAGTLFERLYRDQAGEAMEVVGL